MEPMAGQKMSRHLESFKKVNGSPGAVFDWTFKLIHIFQGSKDELTGRNPSYVCTLYVGNMH